MRRYADPTRRIGWHRCGARRNLPLPDHVVSWRGPDGTETGYPCFASGEFRRDLSGVAVWAAGSLQRVARQGRPIASEVSLASGLGDDADVGLRRLPAFRIDLLGLFVRHR